MTQAFAQLLAELRESEHEFVAIRRDIHAHPELGFAETRTADLVARKLLAWGYEVTTGIGGTGVVGQLRRGSSTRTIGLRADMDALPIQEATGLPYASTVAQTMHACGHDGHTAILLAAAHRLATRGEFDGTLNLIFQPAEEGLGGATRMIEDGLFTRFPCDMVFALHNAPGLPVGQFALRHGCMMASSDTVTITVTGKGTHGAMPQLGCDPIVAAANIVLALQSIVARNVEPTRAAVVTVGAIHAGTAPNVIPGEATLKLSVRALDAATRDLVEARIRSIAERQAQAYGATATVDYRQISRPLVNEPVATQLAIATIEALAGPEGLRMMPDAVMGSEDFSWMTEQVPGCYVTLGNGVESRGGCAVHNPEYDFNDAALSWGAAYFVGLAERYLHAG
ncbi:M20 aminoacylase family protein [Paraburkholderia phenazinium]|jgi:hippurate hydrolase|uniref:Hippurate hydrolase n=1 Tax=Paraburkholderia phenazinium TaxID=60549 RepID=A0A1G7SLM3_9BURK|nr:M20 aminoacylase family protein [Paraburkholderia phenazinium]SDG23913.1 hippurate hydrolase [Paraburkholderia phenazinium]